jgi:hypothetical protein
MNTKRFLPLSLAIALLAASLISCDREDEIPVIETPEMTPNASFTALAEGNQLFYFKDGNLNFKPVAMAVGLGLL